MIGFRFSAAIVAALASIALAAGAQGTTTSDPKKTPKAEPKKAEPKKAPPKKAPPKKVDDKPKATGQGGTVQKYEAGKAPTLTDSKGNTIQTAPDAYDISSATAPPPKKKK